MNSENSLYPILPHPQDPSVTTDSKHYLQVTTFYICLLLNALVITSFFNCKSIVTYQCTNGLIQLVLDRPDKRIKTLI